MPPRRAVELRVGGQTYRVVASDDDQHVQHLAELVDRKFTEVVPHGVGRSMTAQQAMFMTAMALAAEVEDQRARATRLEGERDRSLHLATRAKEVVARLLQRVDNALSPRPASAETRSADSRETRPSQPHEARDARAPHTAESRPAFSAEPRAVGQPVDLRQSHPRLASPLDRLTDASDVRSEPLLIDVAGPEPPDDDDPPADETSSSGPPTTPSFVPGAPRNRPDVRRDVRQAHPSDPRPLPSDPRPRSSPERPAAHARPASDPTDARRTPSADLRPPQPFDPENDATVTRTPRGGLRLVHRASSPPDDETR